MAKLKEKAGRLLLNLGRWTILGYLAREFYYVYKNNKLERKYPVLDTRLMSDRDRKNYQQVENYYNNHEGHNLIENFYSMGVLDQRVSERLEELKENRKFLLRDIETHPGDLSKIAALEDADKKTSELQNFVDRRKFTDGPLPPDEEQLALIR